MSDSKIEMVSDNYGRFFLFLNQTVIQYLTTYTTMNMVYTKIYIFESNLMSRVCSCPSPNHFEIFPKNVLVV